ncbi:MAG: toprim domain-containing protein [Anaerolineae bacterium]
MMMVNTSHINLLVIIERDTHLKKVSSTHRGEYAGPCPFCGGEDRFRVWPNDTTPRFWCRQCKRSGDAIQYIRLRDGIGFKDALQILDLDQKQALFNFDAQLHNTRHLRELNLPNVNSNCPALNDPEWQLAAVEFCDRATDTLYSANGCRAYQYLLDERYLTDTDIRLARLGYNPQDHAAQWGQRSVWLPRGIIIPWWIDNRIWRINIRIPTREKQQRYKQPAGGANGLYQANSIPFQGTVFMTEGEFDALLLKSRLSSAFPAIAAVATGGVSGAKLARSVVQIDLAQKVILAFDADEAGDKAALEWQKLLGNKAVRLRPTEHDITDMVKNNVDLVEWFLASK